MASMKMDRELRATVSITISRRNPVTHNPDILIRQRIRRRRCTKADRKGSLAFNKKHLNHFKVCFPPAADATASECNLLVSLTCVYNVAMKHTDYSNNTKQNYGITLESRPRLSVDERVSPREYEAKGASSAPRILLSASDSSLAR